MCLSVMCKKNDGIIIDTGKDKLVVAVTKTGNQTKLTCFAKKSIRIKRFKSEDLGSMIDEITREFSNNLPNNN